MMRRGLGIHLWLGLGGAAAFAACSSDPQGTTSSSSTGSSTTSTMMPEASGTTLSSSLALTKDDSALWVVNQDSDSVSVIDTKGRSLVAEIPLGPAPSVDPTTKRFDPKVSPRALAIVDSQKVYVVGEAANRVFVLDALKHTVLTSIPVPAAPSGVAAAPDGSRVYVVSHEAGKVTEIDPRTDTVVKSLDVTEHPWSISVSGDGKSLFVTHLLLDPGVSVIDAQTLTLRNKVALAEQPQDSDKTVPNGVARGLYAVVPAPMTGELWVPHMLLAVKTAEPNLDFKSTVFPTISTLDAAGTKEARRLMFQPAGVSSFKGSFSDSVSGPHAVSFTPDGKLALLALGQSEDVMVFDAASGNEVALVRPLTDSAGAKAAMLEGIVVDHAGKHAYVDGRNTHNVAVLSIDQSNTIIPVAVDGAMIDRLKTDPMPAALRHGQRLFYTANSADFPITQNFWVACATCHIEGGSDAVTWLFNAGPRDTPSNAGGPINTGFLLHQALRNDVNQYDETIRVEQGGNYHLDQPGQKPDLDALATYVNYAIPFPQNPYLAEGGALTDSQKRGQTTFTNLCAMCHTGPYFTDSAAGNAKLDFTHAIVLHDIGTCVVSGAFPDKPQLDVGGTMHTACDFDTPTLRGVFATPPYFHDGSARTLKDVVDRLSFSSGLDEPDKVDLVAFLQTL
jgi:YVTN family beta-propeller protein